MTTEQQEIQAKNTYDESPYESYPFAQTTISNLKSIAHIFGLDTPNLETARILELGCASGGNIIPQAALYPKAKFVGVDLSAEQTKVGNNLIKEAGLKNVEIKTASITDIDKSYGEFDYIICHGVLSWVPDFVREAIFKVCSERLSPTGVSYISYNTLPGWNMVRSIRDMMLYHSRGFENVEDQITQSALLLDFIKDTLEESKAPYAEVLKQEAKVLSGQPRNYLRHDHMEEENFQYYFYQFMDQAAKNGLQYLGDASIGSMYIGNLPQKAIEKLGEIKDIVRSEQYMDFITNRRFRSTILCKNNIALNRNLSADLVKELHFSGAIKHNPDLTSKQIEDNSSVEFVSSVSEDSKLNSASPSMKAMLTIFSENTHRLLKFDEIVKMIQAKLKNSKIDKNVIEAELAANLLRLMFSGYINFSLQPFTNVEKVSDKPKVWDFARAQMSVNKNHWVTNLMHERIPVNVLDAHIVKYLDGKHNADDICKKLADHLKKGDISINKGDKTVEDMKEIENDIKKYISSVFDNLKKTKLLVS